MFAAQDGAAGVGFGVADSGRVGRALFDGSGDALEGGPLIGRSGGGAISLSCAGLRNYDAMLALQQKLGSVAGALRFTGSTALDLAYVAAGRLDAGWTSGVKSWDSAAGILLVQESGGLISDSSGNPDCLDSDTLVFGNPKCFKSLLQLASSI